MARITIDKIDKIIVIDKTSVTKKLLQSAFAMQVTANTTQYSLTSLPSAPSS